jgi:hypothetical protein
MNIHNACPHCNDRTNPPLFTRLTCGSIVFTSIAAENHGIPLTLVIFLADAPAEARDITPGWGIHFVDFALSDFKDCTPIEGPDLDDCVHRLIYWAADATRYYQLTDDLFMHLKRSEARRNDRLNAIRTQAKEDHPPSPSPSP